jgi:hypothetical protein
MRAREPVARHSFNPLLATYSFTACTTSVFKSESSRATSSRSLRCCARVKLPATRTLVFAYLRKVFSLWYTSCMTTKSEKLEARYMKTEDRLNAHVGRCRKCEEDRECITVHGFVDAVARAQAALDKVSNKEYA